MNNQILQLKVKQRLNKLASNDYDNIECWQIVEAFNKGQSNWCRRNLHGLNIVKEGDEQSTIRIDDFQILLYTTDLQVVNKKIYYESSDLPEDYLRYKRISASASNDCCKDDRPLIIYLDRQGDVDLLLRDYNKKPSYEWAETFATFKDNKIQIYTNGEFEVTKPKLTYYRQPIRIEILNCVNPNTGLVSTKNVECEFKDDIVEILIDEAVKVLAGDIESFNQYQRAQTNIENNN